MTQQDMITQAYEAFNGRDIDGVLQYMQPDVDWPNGWEGGYVHGHDAVRRYWTRQWAEINPIVTPVGFTAQDNKLLVTVKQHVTDMGGNLLADVIVYHLYEFAGGLIARMTISHPA